MIYILVDTIGSQPHYLSALNTIMCRDLVDLDLRNGSYSVGLTPALDQRQTHGGEVHV